MRPCFVYVTYIRTTPENLWVALTDPAAIGRYWLGTSVDCDFKPGSPWRMNFVDGRSGDTGEILEAIPPRRLVIGRWQNHFRPELEAAGVTRCTFEIEVADYYPDFGGRAVKLTITHEAETDEGAPMIAAVSGGWPKVVANLKSLLETGDIAFVGKE